MSDEVKYIAIDEPSYIALGWVKARMGMTDEDYGMSAPITYARNATYNNALDVMAEKLREIAAMNHVIRSNMSVMYEAAAIIFTHAKRAEYPQEVTVRIGGRVHTVREMP